MRGSRRTALITLALSLCACSGHKDSPALHHAKAACAHWTKINAGITDTTQRQQESDAYQREATAAAAADAKYKPLQEAAETWHFAQGSPATPASVDTLRSAIDQSRAACSTLG